MRVRFLRNFAICTLLTACSVGPSRASEQEHSKYEDGSSDNPSSDAAEDTSLDASKDATVDTCANADESCNGQDDDCDGRVDEDMGMQSCGEGACKVEVVACEGGALANCVPAEPTDEMCNGLDDDCDGNTDEGNLDPGSDCDTGVPGICSAGSERCVAGEIKCVANVASGRETCNGLDDDCNGAVDDGNLDPGGACSTSAAGVCRAGLERCEGGRVQCVSEQQPSSERCNGLDDDCDGNIDEGSLDPGNDCASGQPGVCAAGTTKCVSGKLTCVAQNTSSQEICNGLDDDCDGSKDEGNPGAGASCSTGKKGICASGTTSCSGGSITCTQNQQAASDETCNNGLDDDCNGMVDDGCCTPGTLDCNRAGGCECIGTACCGTGCQSAHVNGLGDYFFDCEPLGTHSLTQAAAACLAHTGDISKCFNHGAACDTGTTSAVCSSGDTECACWTYAGTNKGRVFLNAGSSSCLCPLPDDPVWN